jgi:hypothetical protein
MRIFMSIQEMIVKVFLTLTLVLGMVPIALGQDSLNVYWPDGTPFDCNSEIMVGDSRVLVISSDSNDYGKISVFGIFIAGDDRLGGILTGRGLDPNLDPNDPNARDYTDSHLENAGDCARVTQWRDSDIFGFDFFTYYPVDAYSEPNTTVPGDWFVIDYHAIKAVDVNVGFYIYNGYEGWDEPNYIITLHNVPTRDFDSDGSVDFHDYSIFSSQFNNTGCGDPNWCSGADIDRDGDVDNKDLGLFVEYWLWPDSGNEPDDPEYPEDANVIYSIVDVNGLSEITIDVNESITLYVDIASTTENNVRSFDIEVDISDTNLGSIDNTEHPNGTAQILAEPNRLSFADYWGPGYQQAEGIQLYGTTLDCAIADGHLASFVFTCEGPGDVTLELNNWASFNTDNEAVFPKLESIVIHQIDPEMMMGGETMSASSETTQSDSTEEEVDVDELVSWLEELWSKDKEIKKTYSKAEWNDFIDSVKNLY